MSNSSTKFGRIAWTFAWEGVGRSFSRPTTSRAFNFKFAFLQSRTITQHNARRHFSGGLLLLGIDTSNSSTNTLVNTAESAVAGSSSRTGAVTRLARQAWIQNAQRTSGSAGKIQRRWKHTNSEGEGKVSTTKEKPSQPESHDTETAKKNVEETHDSLKDSVSKYLHLPHLPKMPHRPTKEELLAAATGFWDRLKVRFKWFSIRSTRPFNADEWGAFLSWILFGHFVWILVGTTTFFSLLILMVNTVFAQGISTFNPSLPVPLLMIVQKLSHNGLETISHKQPV